MSRNLVGLFAAVVRVWEVSTSKSVNIAGNRKQRLSLQNWIWSSRSWIDLIRWSTRTSRLSATRLKTPAENSLRHSMCRSLSIIVMKVKGRAIYIPLLTGKREQQQLTIHSSILTTISSGQCSTISSSPLPKQTDFGPQSAARQTHLCPIQPVPHCGLYPAMFSGNSSLFLVSVIYQVLIATHLPIPEAWKAELASALQV